MNQLPLVLIVESDVKLANIYKTWIEDKYRTQVANNGMEAVRKMDDSISAMLVDCQMPGFDGSDIIKEIRERQINCGILMMTTMPHESGILEAEIDEYLLKPATRDTLIKATEDILSV